MYNIISLEDFVGANYASNAIHRKSVSGETFIMCGSVFGGTLAIGLVLRSLWGLYKMHKTLLFYLMSG